MSNDYSGLGFFTNPQFLKIVSILLQDYLLHGDVKKAHAGLEDDPTEYHRRQYVRAVFAQLEGSTFTVKQLALTEDPSPLSNAEIALLRGEQYRLNEAGEATVSAVFLTLARDIKFAFRTYAKSVGLDYTLPITEPGWSALLRAKKVRDRLMHPRSANDLSVTDEELQCATIASDWFQQKFNELSELMMDQLSRNRGMTDAEVTTFRLERDKIIQSKLAEAERTDAPSSI